MLTSRKGHPAQYKTVSAKALEDCNVLSNFNTNYIYIKFSRIFGFYEKPLFLELCKTLQNIQVYAGQMMFSIGDPDDSIYVVQSGRLITVFITESDGRELHLKKVNEGESIASLLSIMDVLTGHPAQYKTVSAKALEDCNVLRLPVEAFKVLLKRNPESLVRLTQAVMVRLQRVTFTALHHYLGLTTQLIKTHTKKPLHSLSPKASPSRPQSRRISQENPQPKTTNDIFTFEKTVTFADKPLFLVIVRAVESESWSFDVLARVEVVKKSANSNSFYLPTCYGASGMTGTSDSVKVRKRKTSFYFPEDKVQAAEEEELKKMAIEGFMLQLGIEDETMVKDYVIVKEHPPNVCLTQEDSLHADLFLVLSGSLFVSQKTANKMEDSILFIAHSGDIVGALAVTTGDPSLFTIKTRHTARIGIIPKDHVYDILHHTPVSVLNLAHIVIRRLSPFVCQIDFALDWINIESGKALYRQDDDSDCMYILLSGRLRSVLTRRDGKKELVGEYGKGDLVGVVEVLTESKRSTTIMAVRDSELAKLPEELLLTIKTKYPEIVQRLIHLLGDSILGSLQKGMTLTSERMLNLDSRPSGSNFATVAIMAINEEVPLAAFTMELYHSLTTIGETLRLTSDFIRKTSGPSAFNSTNEYRLCAWLAQQEDQHKIVLYQCDLEFTPWTQRCIRQADCILIVALANQEPTVGELEKQLEHMSIKTQKELILLHRDDGLKPRNTVQWLNMRSWCSSHHHIRCPKRMFAKKSHTKMMDQYKKIFKTQPNIHSDFSWLSRFLTGTTYGLVLGGGGARGAAHVGMIKAILEAGIPIDMVGGVSIGAFIGALWCAEKDITTVTQKAREWALNSECAINYLKIFPGAVFNRGIKEVFGERQIEDLWLPYFTVTTDITNSTMRIHTHGENFFNFKRFKELIYYKNRLLLFWYRFFILCSYEYNGPIQKDI
ncbi:LOW QUALITY PROTEIN: neuropathy target esterase sws-like [Centruroides sculpturatus]|uniref:LOW QUALITY PROTEIN: neuropathy target esterase sws-like n=1 Tax=Centruroides sculpturatus TaxID=218467 RepID=UPI000C6E7D01|nr:LOW QUALITY PROTEIN: neuropathy target esterase sws-like [Centruroides sculpturatus]